MGRIFGIRKAPQKAFSGTAATIEVTFTGSAEMLADLIATTEFPDLRVRIQEFSADQLKLQIQ